VQSLITARFPQSLFCAIETSGDGKVNVQSRVQMSVFKARQKAQTEYQETLDRLGVTREQVQGSSPRIRATRARCIARPTAARARRWIVWSKWRP
jgi:hypothetical protein